MRYLKRLLSASVLLLITACGGSDSEQDDNTPPVATQPPPGKTAVSRFLQQATFGTRLDEFADVESRGFEGWIDWQVSLPVTKHLSYFDTVAIAEDNTWSQHVNAWWMRSLTANDQLRQRVAFALSEIMVVGQHGVSSSGLKGVKSLSNYYDILLTHSFANYRELMEAVTLNPVMGEYLSMLRNEKPDLARNIRPDENYARELMQLFTIGLVELELNGEPKLDSQGKSIPTYNQDIIEGFAHVFTGWTWGNAPQFKWWDENRDLNGPMKAFAEYHDSGSKTLLNNTVLPAGQTPEQDLEQALDNIFNHPNVGPFIAKQLIQKLVTSNPSKAYVQRVATVFNDNGSGTRGDMRALIKAIYLDTEARDGVTSSEKIFGKIKEPLLRLTALWRAFDAKAANGLYDFRWVASVMAQGPLQAHHVFNFYSPFYAPQGELQDNQLVAPEMEIHTEGTMAKMTNLLHAFAISFNNFTRETPDADDILLQLNRERDLAQASTTSLIEHLDLLLMANSMSEPMKVVLSDYLATIDDSKPEAKAYEAIGLMITSPEFAQQH